MRLFRTPSPLSSLIPRREERRKKKGVINRFRVFPTRGVSHPLIVARPFRQGRRTPRVYAGNTIGVSFGGD